MNRLLLLLFAAICASSQIFFLACGGGGDSGEARLPSNDDDNNDNDLSPQDDDDSSPQSDDDDDDDNDDDLAGMIWIPIPAGTFEMGCVPGDTNCIFYEKPQHQVTLPAFEITKTDVTQGQFKQLMGSNPSYFSQCGDDCPVEQVTWHEASDCCIAAGGRLPTEAEWEYAARAGTTTIWYCGDDPSCIDAIAWDGENAYGETHPVCQKETNAWGLCDMIGNVLQWASDWFDPNYYSYSPEFDPQGPATGDQRSQRGSGWASPALGSRTSDRTADYPIRPFFEIGFRCAR